MKKTSYFVKWILVAIVLLVSVSVAGCTFFQPEIYRTEDPAEYLQLSGHVTNEGMDNYGGLFVFPESIEGLDDVEYRYSCKSKIFETQYMVYLKAAYSEEAYAAEVERLSKITCTIETPQKTVVNSILYSEELFHYPAYIAVYNSNLSHEYALLDEENHTIVYVFAMLYEVDGFLPREYFPLEFMDADVLGGVNWENQNIYYTPDYAAGTVAYVYYK